MLTGEYFVIDYAPHVIENTISQNYFQKIQNLRITVILLWLVSLSKRMYMFARKFVVYNSFSLGTSFVSLLSKFNFYSVLQSIIYDEKKKKKGHV